MAALQGIWLYSYIALWILVLALALGLVAVGRVIGDRLRKLSIPQQKLSGPTIGQRLWDGNEPSLQALLPSPLKVQQLLLIFVSQTCPHCRSLIPNLQELLTGSQLPVVVLSRDAIEADDPYAPDLQRLGIPYTSEPELITRWDVTAVPTVALVNEDGVVTAKLHGNDQEGIRRLLTESQAA